MHLVPRRISDKAEINLALADLRYTGNVDAFGDDIIAVAASDGSLEGSGSSVVRLAWPSGPATRPPTLSFLSRQIEMPEDSSIRLGPVRVRFGNGSSVVQGSVRCSTGAFTLAKDASHGIGSVVVVQEDGVGDEKVVVRGLPEDVAGALGEATYTLPQDWNSRADGVATLTMEVTPMGNTEVSTRAVSNDYAVLARYFVKSTSLWKFGLARIASSLSKVGFLGPSVASLWGFLIAACHFACSSET